tara:strand:+ start:206 stop:979 length:774 start_codon:yes stop_codon:yes gene_type:complete
MHRTYFIQYVIFTALPSTLVFSQVNTEAMRNSTNDYGFTNVFGFDLGFEKSNEEVVELAGKYRLDFAAKNGLNSFLILSYENGYQKINSKTNSIVNKGFSHLRFTKDISNKFFIELFTQYGFNDFLLMKERFLLGSGIRYQVLSGDKTTTHLGFGFMQEDETYDIKENQEMSLLRSTNYITFKLKLSDNTELYNTAYFQFDTKRFDDNRILFDSDMNISINEKLSFNFVINYRRDSEPHGDLGNTYIQLTNGFEYIF